MELICKEDFFMQPLFIGGEEYTVRNNGDKDIILINEAGKRHKFSKDPNDEAYFGKWFDVAKDIYARK
jgi:hypothetical protein